MRETFMSGSMSRMIGVHPKIVQERLGHSTIAVTMDLYSHVSKTMQGDATAKLDDAWEEP